MATRRALELGLRLSRIEEMLLWRTTATRVLLRALERAAIAVGEERERGRQRKRKERDR